MGDEEGQTLPSGHFPLDTTFKKASKNEDKVHAGANTGGLDGRPQGGSEGSS